MFAYKSFYYAIYLHVRPNPTLHYIDIDQPQVHNARTAIRNLCDNNCSFYSEHFPLSLFETQNMIHQNCILPIPNKSRTIQAIMIIIVHKWTQDARSRCLGTPTDDNSSSSSLNRLLPDRYCRLFRSAFIIALVKSHLGITLEHSLTSTHSVQTELRE